MKRNRNLYLACTGAILAAAACASSEDDPVIVDPVPDSGSSVTNERDAAAPTDDGGTDPGDAAIDAGPVCSPAGWCATQLPDSDLTLRDIWPFPGRALAIATVAMNEVVGPILFKLALDRTQESRGHAPALADEDADDSDAPPA